MSTATISLSRAIYDNSEVAWAVVVVCLHYNGACHDQTLALRAERHARTLADGFGRLTPQDPNYEDCLWDWSHVRDSSQDAVIHMAEYLVSRYEGAGHAKILCDAVAARLGPTVRI